MPASVPLDLLGRRPDVAARWRAEAARHAIDTAKAEFYPNINLTAFAGFQAMGTGNLLDAASRMAGIGPAISLPIFHGGALNANLAGRRADADLAVSDYNQSVLDAVRQVADALDGLRHCRNGAEFYPNINARRHRADLRTLASRMAGIGPAISLPIFHGGALNANLAGRADADLAVSDYNQSCWTPCARWPMRSTAAPAGPGTGRAAPGARRHRGGLRPGRQALQGRHG